MQRKYHLQLSRDWPMLNMSSLITCVACSCILMAHTVSPSSLAGEGYTEHAVPWEPPFNKKSVFSAISVIPDINQCQYTTPKIVWACSTFRQPWRVGTHCLCPKTWREAGASSALPNLWSFVNWKRKMTFMKRQDLPVFDLGRFFFLFLFGSVYLISGSPCPPSLLIDSFLLWCFCNWIVINYTLLFKNVSNIVLTCPMQRIENQSLNHKTT